MARPEPPDHVPPDDLPPDHGPPDEVPTDPVPAERLALAASLVRAFPRIGCSLRLPCGRLVMVAQHPAHEPQLSPESFARLLRLDREGPADVPGLRWLRAVTGVRLVGPGLSEKGGLLRVPTPAGEHLAFATLLDVERTREVLERTDPTDDAALEEVTVTLRVDPILGCVVVSTPIAGAPLAEQVEEAMVDALASCMVEELIAGPTAARPR